MSKDDDSPFFLPKDNYDVNSKIMITAIISLSLVVALVTVLHIYARCVLRRQASRQAARRQLGFITGSAVHTLEPPKTGLDPSVMAALPIFIFRRIENEDEDEMGSTECSVCLSKLENGETARTLPNCKHTFHAECIDKWFGSNKTCPICRTEAEPRMVAEPREGPSAPPPEGVASDGQLSASKVVGGSSSRLSSFRRILSRERSSRRMQIQSCGQLEDGLPDLERQ